MSNISESCILAAKDALKMFTNTDLEKYVTDVYNKAKEYTDVRGAAAMDRAIQEVGDARAQMYMETMQLKVNDKAKIAERSKPIEEKKARLLDILTRRLKNNSDNVESSIRAASKTLMDKFFNILTGEEMKFLLNDKNSIDVARALDEKPASDIAKTLAKKFQGYIETRNSEEVNSGALLLSNMNKDRVLKAIHNASKLLAGGRNLMQSALSKKYTVDQARQIWKDFIKSKLHLEKTFEGTLAKDLNGKVDMNKADAMLDSIFDNITTGKPFLIGGGAKQEMFFYWKDNEAWMEYNQKYGRGTLHEAMRADVQASSRQIGMANMFGSNPQVAYNTLAKLENEVNAQSNRVKNTAKVAFQLASGQEGAPVSPTMAAFFSTLRGITGTARLAGRMTIVSMPDIANGIMFAHRYGYSYFGAYGVYLGGMFNALKTEERKYIAGLFKEMTDSHSGYLSRFMQASDVGSVVNNFNNALYKITLMDALDRGNKISAMQLMARILGDNSHLEHAALNDTAKGLLDKFNISENEWNGIRNKVTKLEGRKLLTTDSVQALTNDEVRAIYGVDNDRPLYQLKNDLHRKIYSMFDVASENSVLTPGAFMKASTHVQSGTVVGEILRSILQFKMYSLEFADRVLYQGAAQADGVQNKLKFAALLFGATLPMSWLSNYLDNHAEGKSQPDWNKMKFSQKAQYASNLLLQGVGNMANFLNPENQSPSRAAQYFSTPAIQLLYEGLYAPFKIAEGAAEHDPKKIKDAFKAVAKSVMPGQGLPLVSPYMRQMFGDKPFLQPGQKQIYGA